MEGQQTEDEPGFHGWNDSKSRRLSEPPDAAGVRLTIWVVVEPQLAWWCYRWILKLGMGLLQVLLLTVLVPRLGYELLHTVLRWRARRLG